MPGRSKIVTRMDGTAALVINSVNLEDAGEYSVVVRNKYGEVSSNGKLQVTGEMWNLLVNKK